MRKLTSPREPTPPEQRKLISSALAEPDTMQTAAYAPNPSIESLNISQRSSENYQA
jgi:hypothetical protein